MADLKRWFKVWTTITQDGHFLSLDIADIGRWTMLGALTVSVGSEGVLSIPHAALPRYAGFLQIEPSAAALYALLDRLPNLTHEEGTNRNGVGVVTHVTWKNWLKYQKDTTQAERARRFRASRSKRRGEEKREEKKRIPPPQSPPVTFHIPTRIQDALKRTTLLGQVPRLQTSAFWQAQVRANAGVNFGEEILKAEAWLAANPARAPKKDLARFLHTWLSRAERPPDTEE